MPSQRFRKKRKRCGSIIKVTQLKLFNSGSGSFASRAGIFYSHCDEQSKEAISENRVSVQAASPPEPKHQKDLNKQA